MGKDKGKDDFRKVIGGRARGNGNLWNPQIVRGNEEQLLPGIFNEIVLDHIVPKLPWRAFHILSSVSPCWRLAIQNREIYNARVRSNAVEKLVVFDHYQRDNSGIRAMSMFSVRDESWHQLPKFPFYKKGLPKACSCVASDGNFYVFAHCTSGDNDEDMANDDDVEDFFSCSGDSDGQCTTHDDVEDMANDDDVEDFPSCSGDSDGQCTTRDDVEDMANDDDAEDFPSCSDDSDGLANDDDVEVSPSCSGDSDGLPLVPKTDRELFALDLVGQKGWKRCADMPEPRCGFACCALHGKVYVLGGALAGSVRLVDYTNDKPAPTRECLMYDPEEDSWWSIAPMITHRLWHKVTVMEDRLWVQFGRNEQSRTLDTEVYDPVKNEWSRVKAGQDLGGNITFTAKGKAYSMTPSHLFEEVYSPEEPLKNRFSDWTFMHPVGIHRDVQKDGPAAVVRAEAVDNELLVVLETYDEELARSQSFLCRNRTFGQLPQNRNIEHAICPKWGYVLQYKLERFYLDLEPTTFSQHGWWARFMCPIEL